MTGESPTIDTENPAVLDGELARLIDEVEVRMIKIQELIELRAKIMESRQLPRG
jgi:hypothetical protein